MRSVLSTELRRLGEELETTQWQLVVGGHSRGHLSACTLRVAAAGESLASKLLVLGFDGSWCGQTGPLVPRW